MCGEPGGSGALGCRRERVADCDLRGGVGEQTAALEEVSEIWRPRARSQSTASNWRDLGARDLGF